MKLDAGRLHSRAGGEREGGPFVASVRGRPDRIRGWAETGGEINLDGTVRLAQALAVTLVTHSRTPNLPRPCAPSAPLSELHATVRTVLRISR